MSIQSGSEQSAGYFSCLSTIVSTSARQLVSSASQAHRTEAARRVTRQTLLAFASAVVLVGVLMIWIDAPEIALMPPRGTASLWPFRILTDFGKDTYALLLLIILLVGVVLAAAAARDSARRRLITIGVQLQFLLLALSIPLAVGEVLKWIAGRGRPFVGGQANVFNFAPFAGSEAHASLPSAHSITAFALAFAVAAVWPRLRGPAIAYALLIAFTRLVLLAHHPSDVVAGAAIGIIGATWARYWFAARGLGFAVGEGGIISPAANEPLKGVAAGAPAS